MFMCKCFKFVSYFLTRPRSRELRFFSPHCTGDNREFKQIARAGADTAAGSKFPPKFATVHVLRLHPTVAQSRSQSFVPLDQRSENELSLL